MCQMRRMFFKEISKFTQRKLYLISYKTSLLFLFFLKWLKKILCLIYVGDVSWHLTWCNG